VPSHSRRSVLGSIAGAGIAGLAGCIGGSGAEAVNFGLVPVEADVDVTEQWSALFEHIESETGATIEPNEVADYSALLQALETDRVDICGTPHSIAVLGDREDAADVVGQRTIVGTDREFALVTTHPDDDIESASELVGETVALADPLSTPGSLFPLAMLSEAGIDVGDAPQGEAVDVDLNYSDHTTARLELIERDDVKAAGTGAFSTLSHVPPEQLPDQVEEIALGADGAGSADPPLDLLLASDPIPRPPIVSRRSWDAAVREDIESTLLEAPAEAFQPPDAETPLWFDGVSEGSIDDYDPVAAVMEELGIDLSAYGSD
jgi:phosphonate transport system substrate-binding protein